MSVAVEQEPKVYRPEVTEHMLEGLPPTEIAMLTLAGIEQQYKIALDEYHTIKNTAGRSYDKTELQRDEEALREAEHKLVKDSLDNKRLRMRSALANVIIEDDRFSEVEKAVYIKLLGDQHRREDSTSNLEHLTQRFQGFSDVLHDGSQIFISRGATSSEAGKTDGGLVIEFDDTKNEAKVPGVRVGVLAVGARYTYQTGVHSGAFIGLEKDFWDLSSPLISMDSTLRGPFDLGMDLFVAYRSNGSAWLIYEALSGVDFEIDFDQAVIESVRTKYIKSIDSLARGVTVPHNTSVMESRGSQTPTFAEANCTILRKMADYLRLDRQEIETIVSADIQQERDEIVAGLRTGQSWSELQIAELRLPVLLDEIFSDE